MDSKACWHAHFVLIHQARTNPRYAYQRFSNHIMPSCTLHRRYLSTRWLKSQQWCHATGRKQHRQLSLWNSASYHWHCNGPCGGEETGILHRQFHCPQQLKSLEGLVNQWNPHRYALLFEIRHAHLHHLRNKEIPWFFCPHPELSSYTTYNMSSTPGYGSKGNG